MRPLLGALFVLSVCVAVFGWVLWAMGKAWFWKRAIAGFERSDRRVPPTPGGVVFTGSSSVAFWKTLAQDMAPLGVVNRGFGGSHMAHVAHYADRIVLPHHPAAVVVYAGENDLSWPWRKTAEMLLRDFQEFAGIVQQRLPTAWIYFVSIKPTPLRWRQREVQRRANRIIEDFCRSKPRLQFVDVSSAMLDSSGRPRRDLFERDGLHPSAACYRMWRSILRPILMERLAAS